MTKKEKLKTRHRRVKSRISGTKERPRLSVFRSSKHIYAQLIDDVSGRTIVGFSDATLSRKSKDKPLIKTEKAKALGLILAKAALTKKIKKVVFDRGGFKYHGRVKALAEGAREGGLSF